MNMKRSVCVAMLLVNLVGCGTIFSGTSQSVTISTNYKDSEIIVDGTPRGRGSVSAPLKRSKSHDVLVQRKGCQDGHAVVSQGFNGVSVLNIFLFIVPGFLVDLATGGFWSLDDSVAVYQDCRAIEAAQPATGG